MKLLRLFTDDQYMNALLRSVTMLVLVTCGVAGRLDCFSQVLPAIPGDQILKNIENAFAGIDDYTVVLDAEVDLERLKVPPMHVTMYFKRPDKFHFESDGFALLPREGMALGFGRLRARFSIESVRADSLDGTPVHVLTMKSKTDKSKLHDVLLYVNPEHWTVTRFLSPQMDGRIMTVSFEYKQVEGHWLPSALVVNFASAPGDTSEPNIFEQMTPTRRSQPSRNGTITIRYSDYRLNTGLPDGLFERKLIKPGTP